MGRNRGFKGRQFTAAVILWAVRWYLMFPISYRDLELMLLDRGVEVDHSTIFRWIQAYAAELEKRIRPHLRLSNGSWRVDETYVRVKGRWTYLYRAVDSRGQTIDFLLSAKRDTGGGEAVLSQGAGAAAHGEPAHHHRGQEPGLSKSRHGDEAKCRTLASRAAAPGQVLEQHRGARPSPHRTVDPAGARLRRLLDGPTNADRHGGDGDDQKGADSKHRRERHQGSTRLHRGPVPAGRLNCRPLRPIMPRPDLCNRTVLPFAHRNA